jgi:hypothetical protein
MSGIAITFPSSPVEGQSYLAQNGFTYIYDSLKNRWKRGGDFVRAPKVLSFAGVAVTTTGSGITTGPNGALIYRVPGFLIPSSDVGVDSYKAYRYTDSYPNYTEIQVSISSAFSTIAYAATSTSTTFSIPSGTLSGDTTYYVRARQFVGSNASTASTGAISGYSQNIVSFATTSLFLDAPTIVSIAGTTRFPVYQIGFAGTTLPATATYTGGGLSNLDKVEWRVTGPRIPSSTGDTALAEVGVGTNSSATLANALVLAMPFSGATGVGITNDINGAIRTASGASAGTTKTVTANGGIGIATVGIATTTAHFYNGAAYFNGSNQYLNAGSSSDYLFGTGDFTIESWFYLTRNSSRQDLCGNYSGASTGWGVALGDASSNGMYFYYGNTTYAATSAGLWSTNRWNHIALSRKSGVLSIYLNGSIVSSASASVDVSTTSYSTFIGAVTDTSGNPQLYCMGYLQDLKIYKGLAKYTENFTPPLPTYGTISYTTGDPFATVGVATTAFFESTGDTPTAEVAIGSSTAAQVASSLVLAMPMNRTFGFQDINVAVRGLTSGASAGTAKTVGLGTTTTVNAPTHPRISLSESKWYDGAAYFDGGDYATVTSSDFAFGTGDFTIEGWVQTTSSSFSGGYAAIITTRQSNSSFTDAFHIGIPNDGSITYYSNTFYAQAPAGSIQTNRWHHFAFVRQSGTIYNYVDGILRASSANTQNITQTAASIGAIWQSNTEYFIGYIQDLKIYKGFAKYTANFTPPRPICGFTTDISTQTGFTTTSATGVALTSIVGLGSTSTLAFGADQTYAGITSITSSSGITTLPDPYAQNLVLALPLANITGAGNSFTNDRNTQIRSVSLVGAGVTAGTTKTITNTGVTTVSLGSTGKWYSNAAYFDGGDYGSIFYNADFNFGTGDLTVEMWVNPDNISGIDGLYATSGGSGANPKFVIHLDAGTPKVHLNNLTGGSDIYTNATSTIASRTWTHLAYVRKNSVWSWFINGVLSGTGSNSTDITFTSQPTYIGYGGEGYFTEFNGYIQDLKVYKAFAKYTTNFTPPPPMFGDYTRSSNKIVFTPGSDYTLEARNTATGGIVTSTYSATRQWGTKPKGGIYDPFASNLVLAIPGNNTTGVFDVTGQIKFETPTTTYVNAGIVTYSNSYGTGTYTNKSVTAQGNAATSATQSKYYGRSIYFDGTGDYLDVTGTTDFDFGTGDYTVECWARYETNADEMGLFATNKFVFRVDGVSSSYRVQSWHSDGGPFITGTTQLIADTWYHLAISKFGTTRVIYVNGVEDARGTITQSVTGTTSAVVGTVYLGNANSEEWKGYIQDLRVYKGLAKYTSNFTPPNQIFLT